MFVDNENDFGEELNNNAEHIEIVGDLAVKVKKMMRLNAALWTFCLASLSVTVIAVMHMPATAGTSGIVGIVAGTSAAAILGPEVAVAAATIAIAGGGIHTLKKLRRYRLQQTRNGGIILHLEKKDS